MRPIDLARELALPVTAPSVLMSLLLYFVFFEIALIGRLFGLVIALVLAAQLIVFVLPALLHTLMQLLEARCKGRVPDPPVVEFFSWVGNPWALFPIVHVALFIYGFYLYDTSAPGGLFIFVVLAYLLVLPASLIVLAVTHSVAECLNPHAVFGLIRRRGPTYLVGPLFLMMAIGMLVWMQRRFDIHVLTEFAACYLLFAAFAVFGGMVRSLQLHLELNIPLPAGLDLQTHRERHLLQRTMVLNHAYGLVSRGNRAGGLEHLYQELAGDPDSAAGWAWFFRKMMQWENSDAALQFAQQYLHHLLRDGECVTAVKVMMRCQMSNPGFKPLPDDIPLAIEAAEKCQNEELASFLR